MSQDSKIEYVKWTVFTFIMGILISVAAWFAYMTNNKLDSLGSKVDSIDRRTSFLEGLNEGQKSSFKAEVGSLLTKVRDNN